MLTKSATLPPEAAHRRVLLVKPSCWDGRVSNVSASDSNGDKTVSPLPNASGPSYTVTCWLFLCCGVASSEKRLTSECELPCFHTLYGSRDYEMPLHKYLGVPVASRSPFGEALAKPS